MRMSAHELNTWELRRRAGAPRFMLSYGTLPALGGVALSGLVLTGLTLSDLPLTGWTPSTVLAAAALLAGLAAGPWLAWRAWCSRERQWFFHVRRRLRRRRQVVRAALRRGRRSKPAA